MGFRPGACLCAHPNNTQSLDDRCTQPEFPSQALRLCYRSGCRCDVLPLLRTESIKGASTNVENYALPCSLTV